MLFRDKLVLNVDNVTYNRFKRPCAATTNLVVVLFLLIGLAPVSASPSHAAEGNTVDSQPTSDSSPQSDNSDSENPDSVDGDDAVSSDEEVEAASEEEGAAEEEAPADKSEDEVAEKEAPADDSAETEKESSSDGSSEEESPASESTAEGAPSDEGDITEEAVPATSEEETAEEASSEETTSEESPEAEEPTDEESPQEDAPEEEPVDTKPADEKPGDEDSATEEAEPSEEPEIEPTVSVEEEPVVEIEPDDSQTASRPLPIVDEQEVTPEEMALQKRVIGATATLMEKQSELLFEARIDTGAKSCSLHVEKLVIEDEAEKMVDNIGKIIRFMVKNNKGESDWIESKIDGYVIIKSGSDSRKDQRYKVPVTFRWKDVEKTVSVTLTDRSHMEYPLLVGRNFLLGQFVVDVELDNND